MKTTEKHRYQVMRNDLHDMIERNDIQPLSHFSLSLPGLIVVKLSFVFRVTDNVTDNILLNFCKVLNFTYFNIFHFFT